MSLRVFYIIYVRLGAQYAVAAAGDAIRKIKEKALPEMRY